MRTAELTAHRIYDTYHLGELPDDVKRQLVILFMRDKEEAKCKSYTDIINSTEEESGLLCEDSPINMSAEAVSSRLTNAEADALSGRGYSCEEVHDRIEKKFPWLCD